MANDNDKKSIDLTLTPDDQPEAAPAPQKEVEDLTDKDQIGRASCRERV